MKKILSIALIPCLANAMAIHLGGWSHHFGGNATNENHQAILVEHKGFVGGTMINSYGKRSFALGGTYNFKDWKYVRFNGTALAATGYGDTEVGMPVYPLVFVSFEGKTPYVRPTVHLSPMFAMMTLTVRF